MNKELILSIATIIVCIMLITMVLMQNGKGGGISSRFSAAKEIVGARRNSSVIEKVTWTLAILLLAGLALMQC